MSQSASPQSLAYLLSLPLLQGMSQKDVFAMAERIPMNFQRLEAGKTIVRQGDACDLLIFLIDGEVAFHKRSDDHTYGLTEHLRAPMVFEPECLFGMHTRYAHTISALTDVRLFVVEKRDVRDVLLDFPTFRVNLLNQISYRAQHRDYELWRNQRAGLQWQFVDFLLDRCVRPAGYKELQIKMSRLGRELDTTRLNISHLLGSLREKKLIETGRERIIIPHFENLVNL